MSKPKFPIDPNNLDKSAAAAFREHTAGRLPYAEWKAAAAQIERLRGVEAFRRTHGDALHSAHHPEHGQRTAELQSLYEGAYPHEPGAV
jgi:hypothetical protein